jgi:hypothetical protein
MAFMLTKASTGRSETAATEASIAAICNFSCSPEHIRTNKGLLDICNNDKEMRRRALLIQINIVWKYAVKLPQETGRRHRLDWIGASQFHRCAVALAGHVSLRARHMLQSTIPESAALDGSVAPPIGLSPQTVRRTVSKGSRALHLLFA